MKTKTILLISVAVVCGHFGLSQDTIRVEEPPEEIVVMKQGESNSITLTKADEMPVFPGCEGAGSNLEQALCSEKEIIQHVSSNVTYPADALKKDIQGRVFIEFVVNKQGDVEDIVVIKGVCESMDKAAIEGVKSLPKFKPAMQDGKKVNLKYTIPVNFALRNKKSKKNL